MIGILIISHQEIAEAYAQMVEHFFSEIPDNLRVLAVKKDINVEFLLTEAVNHLDELANCEGLIIFTDIYGATPSNIAKRIMKGRKAVLLTGFNLPMLIKAVQYAAIRDDLNQFAQEIKAAGSAAILSFTEEDLEKEND